MRLGLSLALGSRYGGGPDAVILAVVWVAVLGAIALGLAPPVRWNGKSSRSTWFRIEMMPPEYYVETEQSLHGVYAHERTHVLTDWLLGAVVSTVFAGVALALSGNATVALIAALAGLLLAYKLSQTDAWDRQSELLAKTVEVAVATDHGFDADQYFQTEAATTVHNVTSYGGILKPGETPAQFEAAMRRRLGLARFFAALHTVALRRMPA